MLEDILRKGENRDYQHIMPFPLTFRKLSPPRSLNHGISFPMSLQILGREVTPRYFIKNIYMSNLPYQIRHALCQHYHA